MDNLSGLARIIAKPRGQVVESSYGTDPCQGDVAAVIGCTGDFDVPTSQKDGKVHVCLAATGDLTQTDLTALQCTQSVCECKCQNKEQVGVAVDVG